MAKKKVTAIVKIQIPAGKATPAPPVGTALGPHGIGIMDFVKQYNAATESQVGTVVPVEITIYEDRSFTFILKTPPTPVLLRQKVGIEKGSKEPGKATAGVVTDAIVEEMAWLYHDRGVRQFIFHDDNFLVPSQERNLERIARWREICPEIVIRSTFIAGFPGGLRPATVSEGESKQAPYGVTGCGFVFLGLVFLELLRLG